MNKNHTTLADVKAVGFIGLGNMGFGMASNLLPYCLQNNIELYVLDLNPEPVEKLTAQGAKHGQNITHVASTCDVVFTSLPSAKEVNLVALGDKGILQNAKSGATWFETSTNELAEWQQLQAAAPEHLTLIDAPVTGGSEGAAAGTLTMLLGVDDSVLADFAPLLSAFTKKAVRMGPSGAGYVTKLAQLHLNYLVAQGIGEALMLGAKADLDLPTLWNVLQNSCAQSYVVDSYVPKVLDGSYDESFTLGLATKDMRLISELGQHLNVGLPLGDTVYNSYQTATERYGFDAPHLSIVKLVEEQAGKTLRG